MKIDCISGGIFQSFHANRQCYEKKSEIFRKYYPKARTKQKILAAAAMAGAILPVIALNLAKGKGVALVNAFNKAGIKDKLKAAGGLFEIEDFPGMLASTVGAISAGVGAGVLTDKNPKNKKAKYMEGIFEFLNCNVPTSFNVAVFKFTQKTGKFNSAPVRAVAIAGSVAGGMFIANKASNKINEKCFKEKTNREFKPADCLAHLDDILGLLVIAKIPFAKTIHADKILPLIYARSGYEAGRSQKLS